MKEHDKARAWRESRNMTAEQLSALLGYSKESIYWFERGVTPPRTSRGKAKSGPIPEWVWQRYKRACEGLDQELRTGRKFDW